MPIPVRNVYYLLTYAWDQLKEAEVVDVNPGEESKLVDLLARVLLAATRHLRRRGLEQDYRTERAEVNGIRGRVLVFETGRRLLHRHGRADCVFDDLSIDTLPNRIIKATAAFLCTLPELDHAHRDDLKVLIRALSSVADSRITLSDFRLVRLHGNNRAYAFVLNVCRLVLECRMVDERGEGARFRDFTREPKAMARLFERFLFNFYRIELPGVSVSSNLVRWSATSEDDPQLSFLPTMRTDVTLRSHTRTQVIDAKYYGETLQSYFDSETVHSGHIYQLMAYLRNLSLTEGADRALEGMLLYPCIHKRLRLKYNLCGQIFRVCTVDLSRDWRQVAAELLDLQAAQ